MEYTFSDYLFSDLHKDAYGCRPISSDYERWNNSTDDEKQVWWDYMVDIMREAEEWREFEQKEAIAVFEATVDKTIAMGAGDRATAIRWILDEDINDTDYFCYKTGLPYGYFKEAA